MLRVIYHDGLIGIQSNYARHQDTLIASLASRGWITSLDADGAATRQWRLTYTGLAKLNMENL